LFSWNVICRDLLILPVYKERCLILPGKLFKGLYFYFIFKLQILIYYMFVFPYLQIIYLSFKFKILSPSKSEQLVILCYEKTYPHSGPCVLSKAHKFFSEVADPCKKCCAILNGCYVDVSIYSFNLQLVPR
jgi:hypothetical protein